MKSKVNKFWNFIQSDADNAELIIDGDIASAESWWSDRITPAQFTRELKNLGDVSDITVRINSPGGDVFAANAIYTRLRDHKASITVKIDGWAASAATIICMAGDRIYIPKNGVYMIHNPMAGLCGYYNEQDIGKINAELQVIKKSIIKAYADRTGRTEEEISKLMNEETWWTGEEAVENGFCDELMFKDVDYTIENNGSKCFVNKVLMNVTNLTIPDKIKNFLNNTVKIKREEIKMSDFKNPNELKTGYVGTEELLEKIVDVASIKTMFPELVDEIERNAVAAEHERFKAIDKCTLPGYEKMADDAKYVNPISAAEFSMKVIEGEKQKSIDYLKSVADDVKSSGFSDVGTVVDPINKVNIYDAAIEKMLPNKK